MPPGPLSDILGYDNPAVIARYCETKSVPLAEARALFRETLKLLWLTATHRAEVSRGESAIPSHLVLYPQMAALKAMWEVFLLFPEEYDRLCRTRLGGEPLLPPPANLGQARLEIELQLRYIVEKLGPGTLTRWCGGKCER